MSIFRRKLSNTAAAIPAPGQTTVHHYGVNWPLVVVVAFLCFLLIGPAFWFALVYLLGQLDIRNPSAAAAELVIYGGLTVAFLFFLSWRAGPFFERWLGYKREVQHEITRREEIKLLAAQTTLDPGRMNEDDFRFARVILAVMMIAYKWIEEHNGSKFRGQWRPWSMRSAKETANGIGIKLTDAQANDISIWLHKKGVIDSPAGGQVTITYPDLSNVRLLLEREFGKPIAVVSPALRDNRGFEHI